MLVPHVNLDVHVRMVAHVMVKQLGAIVPMAILVPGVKLGVHVRMVALVLAKQLHG